MKTAPLLDSAAASPGPEPDEALPRLQRSSGLLRLDFRTAGAVTQCARLYQEGTARLRFPRPAPQAPLTGVMINTSGGLTDHDRLAQDVTWRDGAHACLTTQAAERIYRARRGGRACIDTRLRAENETLAEWLPQECLFFDGGGLRRTLNIDMHRSARLIACESVIMGRTARGENLTHGFFHESWRVRVDGHLVWADSLRFDPLHQPLFDRPAIGGRAQALATLVYIGPEAEALTEDMRSVLSAGHSFAGATCLGPLLLVRMMARDGFALRNDLVQALIRLRHLVHGKPVPLPRVWMC